MRRAEPDAAASRRAKRSATDGFLLVETLATFTISAFVLLGLVTAASVLLRAIDGSTARIERVDDLGRALEVLRQDVAGISRARWNGVEPQPFVFRGGPNTLYFAQTAPAADGRRVAIAVALREIVVDGRPVLARSTAPLGARAASFADLSFGPQHEIWTGPARLRFGYVPSRDAGGGEAPVRKSWPLGPRLPAAILIEAIDRDTHQVLVTTRVSIEANADVGCLGEEEAAPTAPTSVTQSDPSRQGAVPPGDPGTVPAPAAVASARATEPFCGLAGDAGGGGGKPAGAAPVGPQL